MTALVVVTVALMLWYVVVRPHDDIINEVKKMRRAIMSYQETVDAIHDQLEKVFDEVVGSNAALRSEIEALREQLANIPGAEVIDFSGLEGVAQRLDDLTPDAEEPSEEVPVEEPTEEPSE